MATLPDFLARPYGSYWVTASYCVWCWSDVLCGTVFRAVPSPTELEQLHALWSLVDQPGVGAVTDLRALGALTAEPFAQTHAYVTSRAAGLAKLRHALLVEATPTGAAAIGLMALAAPGWQAFRNAPEAFEWASPRDGAAAYPEIERVIEVVSAEPVIVSRLRGVLRMRGQTATLASAASELGLSERALQRALADAGTSFRQLKTELAVRPKRTPAR